MRYHEFSPLKEAADPNVRLISVLTDTILSIIRDRLPNDNNGPYFAAQEFYLIESHDVARLAKSALNELGSRGKQVYDFLSATKDNVIFGFYNTVESINRPYGVYYPLSLSVVINVFRLSRAINKADDVPVNVHYRDLIAAKPTTDCIFTLYKTLAHELRHVIQHVEFKEFFMKNGMEWKDYDSMHIELDAEWISQLGTFISDSDSAAEFVTRVMDHFSSYKKLTDKQYKDYYRKTLRFWADRHNPQKDPDRQSPKEKMQQKLNAMQTKVMSYLQYDGSTDENLRGINGYSDDAGDFLLPINKILHFARVVVSEPKSDKIPDQAKMFVYLGGAITTSNLQHRQIIKDLMIKKYGFTPEMAIAMIVPKYLGNKNYDYATLQNFVKDAYR